LSAEGVEEVVDRVKGNPGTDLNRLLKEVAAG
jgi:hypothetical protein